MSKSKLNSDVVADAANMPFQIPVTLYQHADSHTYQAAWVSRLSDAAPGIPVVVLSEMNDESLSEPGLYVNASNNVGWELAMTYDYIVNYVINSGAVSIYYNIDTVQSVREGGLVFCDGELVAPKSIPQSSENIWAELFVIPSGSYGTRSIVMNNDYYLTTEDCGFSTFILTGVLDTDRTLIFPVTSGRYTLVNQVSGGNIYLVTQARQDKSRWEHDSPICQGQCVDIVITDNTDSQAIFITGASVNNAVLSGAPVAPTPALSDSSTKIATTAFVQNSTAEFYHGNQEKKYSIVITSCPTTLTTSGIGTVTGILSNTEYDRPILSAHAYISISSSPYLIVPKERTVVTDSSGRFTFEISSGYFIPPKNNAPQSQMANFSVSFSGVSTGGSVILYGTR